MIPSNKNFHHKGIKIEKKNKKKRWKKYYIVKK